MGHPVVTNITFKQLGSRAEFYKAQFYHNKVCNQPFKLPENYCTLQQDHFLSKLQGWGGGL